MGLRAEAAELYSTEVEAPFPLEEYISRRIKVRQVMAREKIDLLYCTSPESLFYLTGYESNQYQQECPIGVLPVSGIAIKQDADKLILFDSEAEEIKARTYTVGTDIRIRHAKSRFPGLDFIVENLKAEKWLKGTVGLEKWSNRPNPATSEMFQAALQNEGCSVVDATAVVREVRVIKSPQEMMYTRTAARIADIGLKAAVEHIKPGMTEIDVRAEIDYACAKAGGEVPAEPVFFHAGPRSTRTHAPPTRHIVMPGDILYLNLCGVYHRYHADIARTLSLGEPHHKVAAQIDLAVKSWPILLKEILPNGSINDFNKLVEEYYREAGIWEDRWFVGGYELGIAFLPDWVGVFYIGPGFDSEDRCFLPGMVIDYEADFYLPLGAGQCTISDTIAITQDGTEILSTVPPDLIVINT